MVQEEVNAPPKKKLKQAQLSFCASPNTNKPGNKRKLSESLVENEGQTVKMVCRENDKTNITQSDLNTSEDCTMELTLNLVDEETKDNIKNTKTNGIHTKEKSEEKLEDSISNDVDMKSNSGDESTETVNSEPTSPTRTNSEKLESNSSKNGSLESLNSDTGNVFTTPKSDKKAKKDEDLNSSSTRISDSESDVEHVGSVMVTPKLKKTPDRKLTPKQILKRQESEKKRKENELKKQEKQKQKEEMREAELKRKAEIADSKKKEKEEKKQKKMAELMQKNKEKQMKEEEKRQKEEEKRLKEEERKKKEEAKEEEKKKKEEAKNRLKTQARAAFANFFVPKKSSSSQDDEKEDMDISVTNFMPFPVKNDMRLADVIRTSLSDEGRKLLDLVSKSELNGSDVQLYVEELKNNKHIPKKTEGTWPLSAFQEQHDVIIIESVGDGENVDMETVDEMKSNHKQNKAILLQFHDNKRPPYWGTWRKKSKSVNARRPFGRDTEFFDYEVDSDSEWEDEEEGESLEGGDDADKEQSDEEEGVGGENGYLLDNTFVPHGYLSDEEAQEEDELVSPEEQKLRMIVLKEEFEEEMSQKAERLKPRMLGCVWISNDTTEVSSGSLYESLLLYRSVWDEASGPINLASFFKSDSPSFTPSTQRTKQFPKSVVEPLVKLVHGSQLPLSHLVKEFLNHLEKENPTQCVTKNAITRKIKDIASRSFDSNGKQSWCVNADFCNEYGLKSFVEVKPDAKSPQSPVSEKPKNTLLDTYLKNHTPPQPQPPKKRIPLISLPKVAVESNNTPAKPAVPVVRKKVALISMPRTPDSTKAHVHQDTPRPLHSFFKISPKVNENKESENSQVPKVDPEVVDLIDD